VNEGDVALACATLLVDELVRAGVTDACVSPGSRSTPIALALARHEGLRVHVHLDERSAGFFAQGLAKATRRPVAVTCTSGTAVANLLPSVVEAAHSRAPMILLTADRPPELRDTGANQTIDQIGIFGGFVKWLVDARVPEVTPDAAAYWRSLATRAVGTALSPKAGPVHVNLPFREPLVPTGATVNLGPLAAGRPDGQPWEGARPSTWAPRHEDVEWMAAVVDSTERGVILAGALPAGVDPGPVEELGTAAGWPLLAEPHSGLRRPKAAFDAGQHLLADESFRMGHRPDVVLQLGAAPTSRAGQALVTEAAQLIVAGFDADRADPSRSAAVSIRCDPALLASGVAAQVALRRSFAWLEEWRRADEAASRSVNELLDGWDEPFEGRVARDVADWAPNESALVIGSSTPVRDLDAFMTPREDIRVIGNRGASGIDGFVSTVFGVAASGLPTAALAGDLSLLHDVGALLWGARRGTNAILVVVNNEGGGVFDLLPQGGLPELDELFVTPHGIDFGAVASAAGAGYERVEHAGDLAPALDRAWSEGGVWIVEVPIDRASAVRRRAEIREAVKAALTGSPSSLRP
jgi:2-succinyl-5-enolpyruvyl-6-hydroxy-3-cyclohexene-1-carboxylate synthase